MKKIGKGMNDLIDSVIEDAEKEIYDELVKKAKTKLKDKLRQRRDAKRILANIEREIEVIKLEIGHDLEE